MGRFYVILAILILLVGCGPQSTQPTSSPASTVQETSSKNDPAKVEPSTTPISEQPVVTSPETGAPSDQETKNLADQGAKKTEPSSKPADQTPSNQTVQSAKLVEQPAKQPEKPTIQPKKEQQPAAERPTPTQPAPAPAQPAAQADAQTQSVTVSITADLQQVILGETQVELKDGENVLDVLKRITREKKIQMEYSGSGTFAYVEGINNLYEFDKGPKSGWMYRVNGTFGGKSAGATKIKAGDRIEWLYTLDLGKDLERGSSQ